VSAVSVRSCLKDFEMMMSTTSYILIVQTRWRTIERIESIAQRKGLAQTLKELKGSLELMNQ